MWCQVQLAQAKGCHKYIRAAGGGVEWKMLNNLLQCARLLEATPCNATHCHEVAGMGY